jgi:hypothetical protein
MNIFFFKNSSSGSFRLIGLNPMRMTRIQIKKIKSKQRKCRVEEKVCLDSQQSGFSWQEGKGHCFVLNYSWINNGKAEMKYYVGERDEHT